MSENLDKAVRDICQACGNDRGRLMDIVRGVQEVARIQVIEIVARHCGNGWRETGRELRAPELARSPEGLVKLVRMKLPDGLVGRLLERRVQQYSLRVMVGNVANRETVPEEHVLG